MTMSGRGRTGVLTVRIWVEADVTAWRARITMSRDVEGGVATTSVTNDIDAICNTVREWLKEFVSGA